MRQSSGILSMISDIYSSSDIFRTIFCQDFTTIFINTVIYFTTCLCIYLCIMHKVFGFGWFRNASLLIKKILPE
jgi:hypothetical protein